MWNLSTVFICFPLFVMCSVSAVFSVVPCAWFVSGMCCA